MKDGILCFPFIFDFPEHQRPRGISQSGEFRRAGKGLRHYSIPTELGKEGELW